MLSNAEIPHGLIHDMRFTFHSQEQGMETLGNYLREERQKQGKTLKQIAEKTRISRSTLQAIEDDSEDNLPPSSYLRGFLKLYAQELGLKMEDLLERLPEQAEEQGSLALPEAPDIETPPKPLLKICISIGIVLLAGIWAWKIFFGIAPITQDEPVKIVSPRPEVPEEVSGTAGTPAPAEQEIHADADEAVPEPQPQTEAVPQKLPEPAPEPVKEPRPEKKPLIAGENFTVKFVARGIVWMKLQADNDKAADITLRDKEHYRISAKQRLTVRLGNPALVTITYNNQPVPLNSTPGVPLNLVFPDCVQQSSIATD